MSWLSGQFSVLKEQISVATSEFLTQTTTENLDITAELNNARECIRELNCKIESYKSKLSFATDEINDLNFKMESMMANSNHIREEHVNQLLEKDEQIQNLINELKIRREEPEGECSSFVNMPNVNKYTRDPTEFASEEYVQEHCHDTNILIKPMQNDIETKAISDANLRHTIEILQNKLSQFQEDKFLEISAIQETNAFNISRLQDRIRLAETEFANYQDKHDLLSVNTDRNAIQPIEQESQTEPNKTNEEFCQTELRYRNKQEDISATQTDSVNESSDCGVGVDVLNNTIDKLSFELAKYDAELKDNDSFIKSTDMTHEKNPFEKLSALAFLLRKYTEYSSTVLPNAIEVPIMSSISLQTEFNNTPTEDLLRADSKSSICSRDSDNPTSLIRFSLLCEALENAVSFLPSPHKLSPIPGSDLRDTSPLLPWPPKQPEAQVAVLAASEAAARSELRRARDALNSSTSFISQLQAENQRLHASINTRTDTAICLPIADNQVEDNHWVPDLISDDETDKLLKTCVVPQSKILSRNVDVETSCDNAIAHDVNENTDSSNFDNQTDINKLIEVCNLFDKFFTSFCGIFQGISQEEEFSNISELLKSVVPSKCKLIEYVQDILMHNRNMIQHLHVDNFTQSCSESTNSVAINTDNPFSAELGLTDEISTTNSQCKRCQILHTFLVECSSNIDNGICLTDQFSKLNQLTDAYISTSDNQFYEDLSSVLIKLLSLLNEKVNFSTVDENIPVFHHYSNDIMDIVKQITSDLRNNELENTIGSLMQSILDIEIVKDDEAEILQCIEQLLNHCLVIQNRNRRTEEDRAALAQLVSSKHAESQAYHDQLQKLILKQKSVELDCLNKSEKDTKLTAELQRLRLHLLQIEENHTKEALLSEKRESSLRERLNEAEQSLADLNTFVSSADEQITCIKKERDAARNACRATQSEFTCLQLNHANLQQALESIEKENQSTVQTEVMHYKLEANRLRDEVGELQKLVNNLQNSMEKLKNEESANHILHEQIEKHATRLSDAHSEARRYVEQIRVLKAEQQKLSMQLNGKLEKSVMKDLLISCLRLPASKRPDAFRMLGSILEFTSDDYKCLGFETPESKNWTDWFWRSGQTSTDELKADSKKSFVELLAEFLEHESAPSSKLKLPTDYLGFLNSQTHDSVGQRSKINSTAVSSKSYSYDNDAHYPNANDWSGGRKDNRGTPPSGTQITFDKSSNQTKNPLLESFIR